MMNFSIKKTRNQKGMRTLTIQISSFRSTEPLDFAGILKMSKQYFDDDCGCRYEKIYYSTELIGRKTLLSLGDFFGHEITRFRSRGTMYI